MSGICNQPERDWHRVRDEDATNWLKQVNVGDKVSANTAMLAHIVMEVSRIGNIMVDDGDKSDENLCGISQSIDELASNVSANTAMLEYLLEALEKVAFSIDSIAARLHDIDTTIEASNQ